MLKIAIIAVVVVAVAIVAVAAAATFLTAAGFGAGLSLSSAAEGALTFGTGSASLWAQGTAIAAGVAAGGEAGKIANNKLNSDSSRGGISPQPTAKTFNYSAWAADALFGRIEGARLSMNIGNEHSGGNPDTPNFDGEGVPALGIAVPLSGAVKVTGEATNPLDGVYKAEESRAEGEKETTPDTDKGDFEEKKVEGKKVEIDKKTGRVFEKNPQEHGGPNWNVWRSLRSFKNNPNDRDYSVWPDGRFRK